MGQQGPEDPNITTQPQDAQFSHLTNLAQLITGSMPQQGVDAHVQQPGDVQINHQGHGKHLKC